jgi:hypothetical protein
MKSVYKSSVPWSTGYKQYVALLSMYAMRKNGLDDSNSTTPVSVKKFVNYSKDFAFTNDCDLNFTSPEKTDSNESLITTQSQTKP